MATIQEMQKKVDAANKASLAASKVLGTTYKAGTIATYFPDYKEPTSTPTTSTTSATTSNYQISGNVMNSKELADFKAEQARLEAERVEKARQETLKSTASQIAGSGGGSTAINDFYSGLSSADQAMVKPTFGNNIIAGYKPSTGNVQQTNVTSTGTQYANALTPDQINQYYNSQGNATNPLSPADWLKSINQPTGLDKVIDAPTGTGATAPDLPTPTGTGAVDTMIASYTNDLATKRASLEKAYQTQIANFDKKMEESQKNIDELTSLQAEGIEDVGDLMTPFREELENAERERLYITENFEKNQQLTNELETLLTEGNALITQQKEVTGLSSIRNPRIDKTISDVSARAGVIQATMSARNNQISQAYNMIDRSVSAITADKQDQLTYYSTLLDFYENQKDTEGNKLITLSNEKQSYLNAQIGLIENDLNQAQANADYIKELMTDPDTALFLAQSGVTLNDTHEVVNAKMAQQSQRQSVEDFKNAMTADGYTFAPAGNGDTNMTVGGKTLSFNAPVDNGSGTGTGSDEPMSINQIEQFRRSYGWTPPFGYSESQLLQYMNDNPTATPEELEAGAKQVGTDTPTDTPTDTQATQTVEELTTSIMDTLTDEQLKLLKSKADDAGISSMWKGKTTDVKNYLNSIKGDLEDAIKYNYTLDEIITILTQ